MGEFKHILRTQDFTRSWLEIKFFPQVDWMIKLINEKEGPFLLRNILPGKNVILLFYEPSSRTRVRFQMAAHKLGAGAIVLEGAEIGKERKLIYSSEMKEEIFEDTIRTFAQQGNDAIIIRHDQEGMAEKAARVIDEFGYNTSVMNAGDGPGQHPTQALIDVCSIRKHFGKVDGLVGLLLGDLRGGRVMHSLAYLLGKFKVKMYLVAPPFLKMPQNIIDYLKRHNVDFEEVLLEYLPQLKRTIDFWYYTRIQLERYSENEEVLAYLKEYKPIIFDRDFAQNYFRPSDKVYHPFPRGNEITPWRVDNEFSCKNTMDKMPQAGYFEQIGMGVPVSMVLLKMALAPHIEINDLYDNYFTDSIIAQCVVCGRVESKIMGWGEQAIKSNPLLAKIVCPNCRPKQ